MIAPPDKHPIQIHSLQKDKRSIISSYGNKAILEDGSHREEWIEAEHDASLIIDGHKYKFLRKVSNI